MTVSFFPVISRKWIQSGHLEGQVRSASLLRTIHHTFRRRLQTHRNTSKALKPTRGGHNIYCSMNSISLLLHPSLSAQTIKTLLCRHLSHATCAHAGEGMFKKCLSCWCVKQTDFVSAWQNLTAVSCTYFPEALVPLGTGSLLLRLCTGKLIIVLKHTVIVLYDILVCWNASAYNRSRSRVESQV